MNIYLHIPGLIQGLQRTNERLCDVSHSLGASLESALYSIALPHFLEGKDKFILNSAMAAKDFGKIKKLFCNKVDQNKIKFP